MVSNGITAIRQSALNVVLIIPKRVKRQVRHLRCASSYISACLCGALLLTIASQSAYPQQYYVDYPTNPGKVQPLVWNVIPRWMTLDMDLRARGENQTSLGYRFGNNQLYVLTRSRGGLEVRPTKWLTGYLQFHDAHALALPLIDVSPNMRDTFDFRQGFLRVNLKQVTLIAGRQELKYGGERLVGISDWTNDSRTWDGFLGRVGDKNRLDVFSTSVVAIAPTSLDKHGAGLNFHGAVGTIQTWIPHTTLVPFVFVRALPRVLSQQRTPGTETEVTWGAESQADWSSGWNYHILGAIQRGSYSNDSIHSGAGYVKAGYFADRLPWKPRLRGEYDYATGNTHRNSERINTFDQQYPSNHNAFGLTDLFGFQNIKERRLDLSLTPREHLSLLIQQEWLNVASKRDSVYSGGASVVVVPAPSGFLRDGLGREFDAEGKYVLREYMVFDVGVGHFSPDGLLVQNGHGQPLTITYFGMTYRFKVNRE